MTSHDFKIAWRLLIGEPGYVTVVVGGLAIGFAVCFLLLGFVDYSTHYNREVPDLENVYVIKQRFNVDQRAPWFDQTPFMLRLAALNVAGVQDASGYFPYDRLTAKTGTQLHQIETIVVLPGFVQMIGVRVKEGEMFSALDAPDSVVLTELVAQRLFGPQGALGKTLRINGKTLSVGAVVFAPMPNSTLPFEMMVGTNSSLVDEKYRTELLTGATGNGWGKLLVRLQPGVAPGAVAQALQRTIDSSPAIQKNLPPEVLQRLGRRKVMDIALSPLQDAYFDHDIADNTITKPGDRGNRTVVAGLAGIAGLILLMALINYVNLATVRVMRRQREFAVYKSLGATAQKIAVRVTIESLIIALVATTFGLLIAWLALPLFSDLMQRRLEAMMSVGHALTALLIGVSAGLFSAVYPALIALRIRPVEVLLVRSYGESLHGLMVRRFLIVLQISAALCLASLSMAVAWQTRFAMSANPGFDPTPLLIVDLPDTVNGNEIALGFIAELAHQPGMEGIAIATDAVGRGRARFGLDVNRQGGPSVFMDMKSVSANFFEQYRIMPAYGRLFDPHVDKEDDPDPIILNAVAAKALGFADLNSAIGQTLFYNNFDGKVLAKHIIGIAPELRFFSLHETQRPTAYELSTGGQTLTIRSAVSLQSAEQTVRQLWPHYFPDAIAEIHHAGEPFSANYADDERLARVLSISTAVALVIAAFGIYAMSAYLVQRRAREFILRKLYGASESDVIRLLSREIGLLAAVSALIALPIAALAISHYLAGYVEHAAMGYWTECFALLLVLATLLIASVRHTLVAMRIRPAQMLTG